MIGRIITAVRDWRIQRATARAVSTGGWRFDADGWLKRPIRPGDPWVTPMIGEGINAFTEGGFVYCRNGIQAAALDAGRHV